MDLHDRKRKFMDKRFGKLKGFVLRRKQVLLMRQYVEEYVDATAHARDSETKVSIMCDLYDYLYRVRDTWQCSASVRLIIKKKLVEFSDSRPLEFNKYMIALGLSCPYIKRNNEICNKKTFLCKTHQKCEERLLERIDNSLLLFPSAVCNIVARYALPYTRKL